MHGDAVGAESLAVEGHVKQARSVFTPCVAQGRYFVDINDLYPRDPEKAVAPFAEAAKVARNAGLGLNAA